MSLLSWGKCLIEHATSTKGVPAEGELVDSRTGKNTYQFEFDLLVKKGGKRPFEDNDGVISGEHAFRVTPEDEECEGIQIDRSTVRCEESYSTAEGKLLHYVAKVLKPATGKSVKPYTKTNPA